ncbi:MAG: FtsW/RodA/SpoVE family cell cycle protein [Coriobacteriales bacterium]|jgi:cell division protein FtsW|nr:FtsW/RodA/SpoVE family cell cycle protein [Coriobacteriales bacterium]
MARERVLSGLPAHPAQHPRAQRLGQKAVEATVPGSPAQRPHTQRPSVASASAPSRPFGAAGPSHAKPIRPAQILAPRLLLIVTTVILVVFGLVMVYSASFVESFTNPAIQDSSYIFRRQVLLVGIGLVALVFTAAINYRLWSGFAAWLPWLAVLILLVLTWAMGNEELGATRWFDLFGFNLQPSEFAKVAMLLLTGALFVRLRTGGDRNLLFGLIAAAVFFPVLLILLQPDLGTAIIALVGIVAVAYFAECSMKPLAIAMLAIVLVAVAAIALAGFRMGRIGAWLDPWAYASDEGYQIVNSLYAFADGGVTGVGLGMSHQKYLYLPQPHNDLIFPIIGEEFGLIGAAFVVVLFLLFLYAAFGVARTASDPYGRVIAGAAATTIGFQAFLNMLCMANLLPLTGKPLPFFSAGGSSVIVTLMLVGLILNVSLRSRPTDAAAERRDDLVIITGGQALAADGGQLSPRKPVRRPQAGIQGMCAEAVRAQGAHTQPARRQAAQEPSGKGRFRRQPARAQVPVKQPLRKAPRPNTGRGKPAVPSAAAPAAPVAAPAASFAAPSPAAASPAARQGAFRTPASRSPVNPALALSPARNQAARPAGRGGPAGKGTPAASAPQRPPAAPSPRRHRPSAQKAVSQKGPRR